MLTTRGVGLIETSATRVSWLWETFKAQGAMQVGQITPVRLVQNCLHRAQLFHHRTDVCTAQTLRRLQGFQPGQSSLLLSHGGVVVTRHKSPRCGETVARARVKPAGE